MMNWIDESIYEGKPKASWIDSYVKGDGTVVDGHFRTEANETTADNLGTDVDNDGIPGFFDSDADGDGVSDVPDINADGIADSLPIDANGDGIVDTIIDTLLG